MSSANSYWMPFFLGKRDAEIRILQAYMAHFEDTARQAALQLLLKPQKLSKAPGYSIRGGWGLEDILFNHSGMQKSVGNKVHSLFGCLEL